MLGPQLVVMEIQGVPNRCICHIRKFALLFHHSHLVLRNWIDYSPNLPDLVFD